MEATIKAFGDYIEDSSEINLRALMNQHAANKLRKPLSEEEKFLRYCKYAGGRGYYGIGGYLPRETFNAIADRFPVESDRMIIVTGAEIMVRDGQDVDLNSDTFALDAREAFNERLHQAPRHRMSGDYVEDDEQLNAISASMAPEVTVQVCGPSLTGTLDEDRQAPEIPHERIEDMTVQPSSSTPSGKLEEREPPKIVAGLLAVQSGAASPLALSSKSVNPPSSHTVQHPSPVPLDQPDLSTKKKPKSSFTTPTDPQTTCAPPPTTTSPATTSNALARSSKSLPVENEHGLNDRTLPPKRLIESSTQSHITNVVSNLRSDIERLGTARNALRDIVYSQNATLVHNQLALQHNNEVVRERHTRLEQSLDQAKERIGKLESANEQLQTDNAALQERVSELADEFAAVKESNQALISRFGNKDVPRK